MVPTVQDLICPIRDCPNCGHKLSKMDRIFRSETFLGFDGDKVPDIDLNFSGEDQPSAHLDVVISLVRNMPSVQERLVRWLPRLPMDLSKGYERDYGKFYRDAEVERLAQGAAGVKRTTGQHPGGIVVIPNYMDVYDFTPVQYPADDVTAEWQTTHFNFHDIDENVLKLDVLGHDDPTMIPETPGLVRD